MRLCGVTLLAALTLAGRGEGGVGPGGQPPLVARVLAALDNTIHYFENNYQRIHFDGIFGAKAIEGQLNLLVAKYNKGFLSDAIDSVMKNDIAKMAARAGRVVKLAIPHLQNKYPDYMKRLRRLFQLSWDIGHSHRFVDMSLLWSDHTRLSAKQQTFSEVESDHCVGELLEPVNGVMCSMTQGCQQLMTQPGRENYALTHQILYSIVAEMSGCGSRFEQWLVKHRRSGSVEQLQGEMCSNLYAEANTLPPATLNSSNPVLRDLFLESEFVCGMLGYVEFLQEDWLRKVLGWQSSSGCFSATPLPTTVGRKLLLEQMLPDGCLSHLTAVAGSALAVHLHYLLYPGYSPSTGLKDPQAHGAALSTPSPILQPPKDLLPPYISSGIILNKPIFRGNIHSGLNRVAEQEKSLEDKADIVLKKMEERKTSTIKPLALPSVSPLPGVPLGVAAQAHGKLILPEQAVPLAQLLTSTKSVAPVETSLTPLYFVICSIALMVIVMVRYIHTRRRAHLVFKNKFRI